MTKKIRLLTIVLGGLINFVSGQTNKIDSSVYFRFSKLDYVNKVYYFTSFYKNGQIKEEGWEIGYQNKKGIKLPFIQNIPINEITYAEAGIWKQYYKNGNIKSIDTIPQDWINSWGSQTYYDKKGNVFKRILVHTTGELATVQKDLILNKDWTRDSAGDQEIWIYYKKGKEIKRVVWQNGKRTSVTP